MNIKYSMVIKETELWSICNSKYYQC